MCGDCDRVDDGEEEEKCGGVGGGEHFFCCVISSDGYTWYCIRGYPISYPRY